MERSNHPATGVPGTFSKPSSAGGSGWTIPVGTCAIVGVIPPVILDGASPMPTITQRISGAFAVLCGQYGDVTRMAKDREQSRQSLYREARQVAEAVDGASARARIDELERRLAERQAEVEALE